jgi:hypothetical protein
MIKVYTVKSYVSINGEDWWHIGYDGHSMRDDGLTEKVFFENFTFDECYQYIKEHSLDGIWPSHTLFRNKPILYIGRSFYDSYKYTTFKTISYKYIYKEWDSVPLTYIMEHFSADQCIQYLKERGMTTCPILK